MKPHLIRKTVGFFLISVVAMLSRACFRCAGIYEKTGRSLSFQVVKLSVWSDGGYKKIFREAFGFPVPPKDKRAEFLPQIEQKIAERVNRFRAWPNGETQYAFESAWITARKIFGKKYIKDAMTYLRHK